MLLSTIPSSKYLRSLLGLLLLISNPLAAQQAQDFFSLTDQFLQKHVQVPNVDYAAIQEDSVALAQLLQLIANYPVEQKDPLTQKAFWINAYNLLVIRGITAHYPVQSPKDISGFFDRQKYLAAGETMTLNQLENNLGFFQNSDDSNPLFVEVQNNIKKHKENLAVWRAKMDKLKALK